MIDYVTGTLGHGKSAYAVRGIARALMQGRAVAGNHPLVDDWAERVARRNPYCFGRPHRVADYAAELRTRFHYADTLEELTWLKLRGKGEERGLLVLDEAHNELNNRDWMRDESKEFLRWLTMLRKKGWRAMIVSQHAENTDKGARRIAENEVRMINWKKLLSIPLTEMSVLPWPVFLALRFPANLPTQIANASKPNRRTIFPLGWWRNLYNTHLIFGEDESDELALWLPSDPSERSERAAARAAANAAARALLAQSDQRGRRRSLQVLD